MADHGPRWVLCHGATHRDAPEDALRLGIGDGAWNKVTVDIEGLEKRMTGTLLPALHDLMTLAVFVLAADCASSRGSLAAVDNGESWRREFHMVVPVADPDRWRQTQLLNTLETTLGFLSDDIWHFHFVPCSRRSEPAQVRFAPPADGRTFTSWGQVDEVMLFSGGMDSFSGAVDACLGDRRKPLLVSHRSSSKVGKVQRDLLDALRRRSADCSPWYLAVDVHRHTRPLREEESQRSRSFLFAAIAGAVSWLAGRNRLTFHENGIIALNLPISAQLQGARGTRTVHPRVMEGFANILTQVSGQDFEVKNPYQWHTRAQVAENLRDRGVADLLRLTRSCATVRRATKQHPFCGVCSQCVDRQFAVRAARLHAQDPEGMYALRIFEDPLVEDRDIQLAVSYVAAARSFSQLTGRQELQTRYGEVLDASDALARQWGINADQALDRIVDLHRRQGDSVLQVLGEEIGRQTPRILDGAAHPSTLLSRSIDAGLAAARRTFDAGAPAPDDEDRVDEAAPGREESKPAHLGLGPGELLSCNVFYRAGAGWVVGLQGAPATIVKESAGMHLLCTLLRHPRHNFAARELEAANAENPNLAGAERLQREVLEAGAQTSPLTFEVLDARAVSSIRERIQVLRADEEEALENCDERGAEEARIERESLEDRLLKDQGRRGQAGQVPPEIERARNRVSKSINRAYSDIAKENVPLKRYLSNAIRLGYDVVYLPHETRTWVTSR